MLLLSLLTATTMLGSGELSAYTPGVDYVPNEILIKFRTDASSKERQFAFTESSSKEVEHIYTAAMKDAGEGGVILAKTKLPVWRAIEELQTKSGVEYAEPNWIYHHTVTSNDTHYVSGILWGMYGDLLSPTNQWGCQANEAWAAGHIGSTSVYVATIDEGAQFAHEDLAGQIWTNPFDPVDGVDNDGNGYVDDIHGWDFAGNNNTTYDGTADDHGTHVSGTIGAIGGNAKGVVGVCWNIRIITLKFLGAAGGTTANAIKAVDYATNMKTSHGLNLVATNNSWGGGGFSSSLQSAITRANNANILFVAAAGNGGADGVGDNNDSVPNYPSNYTNANVIAVASITSTGARSSFSNYGATSVDLGAPGSSIASTYPNAAGNGYAYMSGTSMATPHVTGACALYASTHPGATAATIKSAILSSTVATPSLAGLCVTGGRLNVSGF